VKAQAIYYRNDEEVIEPDLKALKQDTINMIEAAVCKKELDLGKLIKKDTDLKILADFLLNDSEVKSKLEIIGSIYLPRVATKVSLPIHSCKIVIQEKTLDFLSCLGKGGFFLNRTVETHGRLYENAIATLEILTSQKLAENLCPKSKVEIDFIKTFNKHFSNESPNSYLGKLKQFIEITTKEVGIENHVFLNEAHCLRILSEFNWSNLSENYLGLPLQLSEIFNAQQVTTESYHLERAPGLHYYKTKITQKNYQQWLKYYYEQSGNTKGSTAGLCAFDPSLDFFDWASTEAWVAFISDMPQDSSKIYISHIEMAVIELTSKNSSFTSHSGIHRGESYIGKKHQSISGDFHSFVSKTTQMHEHTVNKDKMITCPTHIMGEIIIKILEKHAFHNKFYIGFEDRNALLISEEHYPHHNYPTRKFIVERICKQNVKLTNGDLTPPTSIKMSADTLELSYRQYDDESNKCLSFKVKDNSENVIQSITPEQMMGEYAWFFTHPYLFEGLRTGGDENLLTVDIDTLSQLLDVESGQIQYECKVETIGEVDFIL